MEALVRLRRQVIKLLACGARGLLLQVRGSIPSLAATISEIGYLLLPSRDMAERSLKWRKSTKLPTNRQNLQTATTFIATVLLLCLCINLSTGEQRRAMTIVLRTFVFRRTKRSKCKLCIEDLRRFNNLSVISQLLIRRYTIFEIQVARPGIEPQPPCSAIQKLIHSTDAAPNVNFGIFKFCIINSNSLYDWMIICHEKLTYSKSGKSRDFNVISHEAFKSNKYLMASWQILYIIYIYYICAALHE